MLFVNSKGQPIIRSGQVYPRDCGKCPCGDCGECTTSCYYSVLHHVDADYPGVIAAAAGNVYHCQCTYEGSTFDLYLDGTSKPLSQFRDGRVWYDLDDVNPNYDAAAKTIYDSYCLAHPDDAAGQLDAYQIYLETKDKYNHYYSAAELEGLTGRWRSDTPLSASSTFTNRKHALGLLGTERPQYYVSATMEVICKNKPEEPLFDTNGIRYQKGLEGWIVSTDDCDFGPPRKAKLTLAYFNIFKFTATVAKWNATAQRYEEVDTFVHWSQNITDKPVALFGAENVTVLGGSPFPLDAAGVAANNVPDWMDPDWHWSDHRDPSVAIQPPDFYQIYNFYDVNGNKQYNYFRHAGDYAYNENERTIALTDFDNNTAGVCYFGNTTCENSACNTDLLFTDVQVIVTSGTQTDPSVDATGDIDIVRQIVSGTGSDGSTIGGDVTGGDVTGGDDGSTTTTINVDNGTNTTVITIETTPNSDGSSTTTITIDNGFDAPTVITIETTPPDDNGSSSSSGSATTGDGDSSSVGGSTTTNDDGSTTTVIVIDGGDDADTTITIDTDPNDNGDGGSTSDVTVDDGDGEEEEYHIVITPVDPWTKEKVPQKDPCRVGNQHVHYRIDYTVNVASDFPDYEGYTETRWTEGIGIMYGSVLDPDHTAFYRVSFNGEPEVIEESSVAKCEGSKSSDCTKWLMDTIGVGFAVSGGGGYRFNIDPQTNQIVTFSVPKKGLYFYGTIEYAATGSRTEEFAGQYYTYTKSVQFVCTVRKETDMSFE